MQQRWRWLWGVLLILVGCGGGATTTAVPASNVPLGLDLVVEAIGPIAVGEEIPELRFQLNGQTKKLSDYRGKTVVINFWATWCEPCRREMPDLEAISRQRPDVVVLGINLRENEQAVRAFAAKLDLSFPLLLDRNGAVAQYFGVGVGLPTTYFVDSAGIIQRIQFAALTRSELNQHLDNLKP